MEEVSVDSKKVEVEVDDDEGLTHSESVAVTSRLLNSLLQNDPLLCDLPRDVTLQEVNAQIAVQTGSALTVEVLRGDGEVLRVVVERSGAKLCDLRRALQRHIELLELRRTGRRRLISWRHVWKVYCLQTSDGERLTRKHDCKPLASLNIVNKSRITFAKRLRDKLQKE